MLIIFLSIYLSIYAAKAFMTQNSSGNFFSYSMICNEVYEFCNKLNAVEKNLYMILHIF